MVLLYRGLNSFHFTNDGISEFFILKLSLTQLICEETAVYLSILTVFIVDRGFFGFWKNRANIQFVERKNILS